MNNVTVSIQEKLRVCVYELETRSSHHPLVAFPACQQDYLE